MISVNFAELKFIAFSTSRVFSPVTERQVFLLKLEGWWSYWWVEIRFLLSWDGAKCKTMTVTITNGLMILLTKSGIVQVILLSDCLLKNEKLIKKTIYLNIYIVTIARKFKKLCQWKVWIIELKHFLNNNEQHLNINKEKIVQMFLVQSNKPVKSTTIQAQIVSATLSICNSSGVKI